MLLVGVLLGLACSLSLTKLLLCVFAEISPGLGDKTEVDIWLQENDLQQYQIYFRERGKANVLDLYFLLIEFAFKKTCRLEYFPQLSLIYRSVVSREETVFIIKFVDVIKLLILF
jgi:hypothetical protein